MCSPILSSTSGNVLAAAMLDPLQLDIGDLCQGAWQGYYDA